MLELKGILDLNESRKKVLREKYRECDEFCFKLLE